MNSEGAHSAHNSLDSGFFIENYTEFVTLHQYFAALVIYNSTKFRCLI